MATCDIIAFAYARLDEEEAAAKAATAGPWSIGGSALPWVAERITGNGGRTLVVAGSRYEGESSVFEKVADAEHIVRHDPARTLRDIEHKRAILAEHEPYDCSNPAGLRCDRCVSSDVYPSGVAVHEAWPCKTVRLVIARWDDHPDYEGAWKP